MNLFDSARKLVAFSGCNSFCVSIRDYNAPTTAISKLESFHLRRALYQVALTVSDFNPTFKSYCSLKRSQGKSHRCAQGHVVRKLLRVIFKLLTENLEFNPDLSK
ncbi:transposase [Erysipelothrix larvae]|uniref:transposase n=1 Tax=Erysipelothrix larvae TaxID=1514105 RepID=UPI003AADE088